MIEGRCDCGRVRWTFAGDPGTLGPGEQAAVPFLPL